MADSSPTRCIALVVLTGTGLELALRVQQGLMADTHIYASERALKKLAVSTEESRSRHVSRFEAIGPLLAHVWKRYDQIVLIFALGAAVRLFAPLLQDKRSDPGVVVIDDAGTFAISVVSGHAGDANSLARRCAELLGAIPVITTASDVHSTLALDMLSYAKGWHVEDASAMTAISAAIVNGEPVALLQEAGELDWWEDERPWPENLIRVSDGREVTASRFAALLVIADRLIEALPDTLPTIVYRPPTLVLGVGCRRNVPFAALDVFVRQTLAEHRIAFHSIAVLATADIKVDETALRELVQCYNWRFETYSAEALRFVTSIARPSERVRQLVGTPSVSEAAALLSSQGGELLVEKQKGESMTLAVARKSTRRDNPSTIKMTKLHMQQEGER